MEVHAFNTKDVEVKLYDIMAAFDAITLAVNGLKSFDQISDHELAGFEYIVRNARGKAGDLLDGLQPVWFQESGKVMVLIGEEE